MNIRKILFLSSLILIFINIIILENTKEIKTGQVIQIIQHENIKIIRLNNDPLDYVAFTNQNLNIQKKNIIKIIGKESTYNNQKQIIIDKIILLKK